MRPEVRSLACLLVAATATASCTHTYIYGEQMPPTFERGKLVVPSSAGGDRYSVRRIGVSSDDDPFAFRPPTSDEIELLKSGIVPDGVHTLRDGSLTGSRGGQVIRRTH